METLFIIFLLHISISTVWAQTTGSMCKDTRSGRSIYRICEQGCCGSGSVSFCCLSTSATQGNTGFTTPKYQTVRYGGLTPSYPTYKYNGYSTKRYTSKKSDEYTRYRYVSTTSRWFTRNRYVWTRYPTYSYVTIDPDVIIHVTRGVSVLVIVGCVVGGLLLIAVIVGVASCMFCLQRSPQQTRGRVVRTQPNIMTPQTGYANPGYIGNSSGQMQPVGQQPATTYAYNQQPTATFTHQPQDVASQSATFTHQPQDVASQSATFTHQPQDVASQSASFTHQPQDVASQSAMTNQINSSQPPPYS